MGSLHQPQPDVPREKWGDMRGDEMETGDLWKETPVEPPKPKQQEGAAESSGPKSPDKAAGSRTLEQKLAELDTMPNFESK